MKAVRLDSLKAQREAAGLTISMLARLSNTSDALIVRLESKGMTAARLPGSCTEMEAERIANALGVSLSTLGRSPL